MKIKQIEYTLGYTVNLGNYESMRPEMKIVAELDGGENEDKQQDAFIDLFSEVRYQLALSLYNDVERELLQADLNKLKKVSDESGKPLCEVVSRSYPVYAAMHDIHHGLASDMLNDALVNAGLAEKVKTND